MNHISGLAPDSDESWDRVSIAKELEKLRKYTVALQEIASIADGSPAVKLAMEALRGR